MLPIRLNIMIVHAAQDPWAVGLAGSLKDVGVNLHWSRNEDEVLGLARQGPLHLGVVDDAIPEIGGLGLLRRMRRHGLDFPCLLVSRESNHRHLRDALDLDVVSVILAAQYRDTLVPTVMKVIRERYNVVMPAGRDSN